MFTQCPQCHVAFRVTAKVLQQAAGNVRCGNCGDAFNAVTYLSETMPAAPPSESESGRRLRESLDELTGPDEVRIEDTGIEWRVLNGEPEDEAEDVPPASDRDADDRDADDAAQVLPVISAKEERRYDDNTPLPDSYMVRNDEDYAPPQVPGRRATDQHQVSPDFVERQGDLALSEPEDWQDLLDEVRHDGVPVDATSDPADASTRADPVQQEEESRESRLVISDEEFDAPEDALTDEVPLLAEPRDDATAGDADPDADSAIQIIEDESYPAVEDTAVDEAPAVEDGVTDPADREDTGEFEAQIDAAARAFAVPDDEDVEAAFGDWVESTGDEEGASAGDEVDLDESALATEADDTEAGDTEAGDTEAGDTEAGDTEAGDTEAGDRIGEFVVLPPTEEEMSVNMEIDQELMAAAVQDDEFSATLVGMEKPAWMFDENTEGVETIIMEGDFVRTAVDEERLAAENAARNQLGHPDQLFDTYAASRKKPRLGRRRDDLPPRTLLAAAATLVIVLAGQFIHQSRTSLATVGMFNQTLTPVYSFLGEDLTPNWDVTGWQFEATSGSVDDANTTLTIVSRLQNAHGAALPYPLLHVSLTDRWEEIIGSKVLTPGDYLAGNPDRGRLLEPGETFTAVIAVEDASADATGFKLNVCYPATDSRVRCAIQDFKN